MIGTYYMSDNEGVLVISDRYVFVMSKCVFFFKQKTAYEMRISDWTSDVCSSDLPGVVMWHVSNELGCHNVHCYCDVSAEAFRGWLRERYGDLDEIGRASCRERVRQYV